MENLPNTDLGLQKYVKVLILLHFLIYFFEQNHKSWEMVAKSIPKLVSIPGSEGISLKTAMCKLTTSFRLDNITVQGNCPIFCVILSENTPKKGLGTLFV